MSQKIHHNLLGKHHKLIRLVNILGIRKLYKQVVQVDESEHSSQSVGHA
jgi:hypothetical protein